MAVAGGCIMSSFSPTLRDIEQLGRKIGDAYHPQRVILFGSHAWGKPTADSVVDVLVILPFEGDSVRQSVDIRMRLRPPFPVDLLVHTPKKIAERLALGDPFIQEILAKGRVLYEAPGG